MTFPVLPASTRKAIYAVAVAAVALLVGYRLLAAEAAPLWLALIGSLLSLLAPVTALNNITPDDSDDWIDENGDR